MEKIEKFFTWTPTSKEQDKNILARIRELSKTKMSIEQKAVVLEKEFDIKVVIVLK
jgi:hypothetical protein